MQEELLNLITETKKQLEHLKVLGVDGIQSAVVAPPPQPITKPAVVENAPAVPATSLFGDMAPEPVKLTCSTETFEQVHAEIGDCTRCPLFQERTHVVHTEGNRKARLMF